MWLSVQNTLRGELGITVVASVLTSMPPGWDSAFRYGGLTNTISTYVLCVCPRRHPQ